MNSTKKLFILYFYLKQLIKKYITSTGLHNQIAAEEPLQKENSKGWIGKLILKALVTSIFIFFTIVYLHQGNLFLNQDGTSVFNKIMAFELTATFVFLLSVFLVHRGISSFVNLKLKGSPIVLKSSVEALLVIFSAVLLLFVTVLIPFFLVFPEIDVIDMKIRLNYIFMAILALIFYYFGEREQSKRRLEKELLRSAKLQKESFEAQLQHLRNQMNPHFLFNSLNVLATLIRIDQARAIKFVQKLSEVYRAFLQNSEKELISLEQELNVVKAYTFLLKTRFGDAITFNMEIPEEKKELFIPPGALQSLIENAVKHNGSTRKDPLVIKVTTEDDSLIVSNKIKSRKTATTSTQTGLKNLINRYRFLTDKQTSFQRVNGNFIAEIPLLKLESKEEIMKKQTY
ncbi:sensor histidine kinase [Salegentibacter sediminis]|uniref:sensor histidine kinase n=1 Tax=Salegentibacter sediminis TaxID=1930251 RepID=UPI0009BD5702|nr:histidine kinase [Salegentibacter sediminis]